MTKSQAKDKSNEEYVRGVIIEIFENRNLSGRTKDLVLAINDLTELVTTHNFRIEIEE